LKVLFIAARLVGFRLSNPMSTPLAAAQLQQFEELLVVGRV